MCVIICLCLYVLVCEWSTADVCTWLRDLDLGEHCDTFMSHDIRGRELLTLARNDLKVPTTSLDSNYLYLKYLFLYLFLLGGLCPALK